MNFLANINWLNFGIVLLILAVLAIIFTILILLINKFCAVNEDPKIAEVSEHLSGANCGGCGFAGCVDFAKALVLGKTTISACSSTSKENREKIASILGQQLQETEKLIAVVKCAGANDKAKKKFTYIGNTSCDAVKASVGSDKICNAGCLGGGTCLTVCKFDALTLYEGVAKTIKQNCTACGACVRKCPKNIISLIPATAKVYVACSSNCKGKEVLDACTVGCIGCGICAKNCPEGAITMVDNLPVIDYSKCTACGTCVSKCPRKTIRTI